MGKSQISGASVETLNARREELVNAHGIQRAKELAEWHSIDRELDSRKAYQFYEAKAWEYVSQITQYQPSPYARDGQ